MKSKRHRRVKGAAEDLLVELSCSNIYLAMFVTVDIFSKQPVFLTSGSR